MTCLVLGGGGFIGSKLVDRLLKEHISVRIFEHPNTPKIFSSNIEWVTGDFNNKDDLLRAASGCSAVFHLISTTLPQTSFEDNIFDIKSNIISSVNLLDVMLEHDVKKIIFASSGGTVYGEPQYLPIDEKHKTDPYAAYGISKLTIEKYILMYAKIHNFEARILRIANPYGRKSSHNQGLIDIFLDRYMRQQEFTIWGDGEIVRDYLHIDDVIEAFLKVYNYQGKEQIFNIGSSVGRSVNQVIKIIEDCFSKKAKLVYVKSRAFDVSSNVLDCSLAQKELSWCPRISLEGYLKKLC